MQLDQTHVVIRVRSLAEIGDLALVMIRAYPSALVVGFLIGCLPWAIVNLLLLGRIPYVESEYGFGDQEAASELMRYLAWMTILVISQTQIAGAATTYYLGQAVFEHAPTWRSVFAELYRQRIRLVWRLGVLRMPIPIMTWVLLQWIYQIDVLWDVLMGMLFLLILAISRSGRPFLPEVLVLEQCPTRSSDPAVPSLARRMKGLHQASAGNLTGRMIAVSAMLAVLTLIVYYTAAWMRVIATGRGNMDLFALWVLVPISLWLVAGISVFVRLLNYLDTRIRLEGWEVDLAVRAEYQRQFGQPAVGATR